MEKFTPYEKLLKKARREVDARGRGSWGDIRPVTRKPISSKAYQRKKTRIRNWELPDSGLFCFFSAGQKRLPRLRTVGYTDYSSALWPASGKHAVPVL